jgi:PAS domain-containing protein
MNSEEIDFLSAQVLRSKAEEHLRSKQDKERISEEVTDLKKMLHELQVHQIELEMQNEELRNAYDIAEAALKKYTMLFDLSSTGYFTLDSEGSIKDLNFSGAKILGERRFSLIDSNFKLFVAEASKPVFNDLFRRAYISNATESSIIQLGYNNKPLSSVYIEGVVTEDDQKLFLTIIDISMFTATRE